MPLVSYLLADVRADEVIIGAPYVITKEMITVLNIKAAIMAQTQSSDIHEHKADAAAEHAFYSPLIVDSGLAELPNAPNPLRVK